MGQIMSGLKLKGNQLKVYGALSAAPNMAVLETVTDLNRKQIEDAIRGLRAKGVQVISNCFKIRIVKKRPETEDEKNCEICDAYECVGSFK
jgi:hypothetical protein